MTQRADELTKPVLTDEQLHRYEQAVVKGCQWLLDRLQADGTFRARNHNLRCYLKSPLALLMAGEPRAAYALLDTMKKKYLHPDGDFRTSSEVKYAADRFNQNGERNYYLYGNGWATISAHVNGRFDISYPALAYLLPQQDPTTGGFFSSHHGGGIPPQRQDVASTASCGYALLFCGRAPEAARTGDFFLRLAELQSEPERFYLSLSPAGGVVDRFLEGEGSFRVVDQRQTKQPYWMLAYAAALLTKIHLSSKEQKYLDGAVRYFDFLTGCQPDFASFFGCWKVGWAGALLGIVLKDERRVRCAVSVLDYIVSAQEPEGYWDWGRGMGMGAENDDWLFDLSSEMIIWLSEIPRILARG